MKSNRASKTKTKTQQNKSPHSDSNLDSSVSIKVSVIQSPSPRNLYSLLKSDYICPSSESYGVMGDSESDTGNSVEAPELFQRRSSRIELNEIELHLLGQIQDASRSNFVDERTLEVVSGPTNVAAMLQLPVVYITRIVK